MLKRGLENAMMNEVCKETKKRGIKNIIGYYYPTSKNSMVKEFYPEMGFGLLTEDKKGNSIWKLVVNQYLPRITYFK